MVSMNMLLTRASLTEAKECLNSCSIAESRL
jgi:hypothetical protein